MCVCGAFASVGHVNAINEPSESCKRYLSHKIMILHIWRGRDSSVGIATRYGLDGPGIESRCEATFSAPVQTGPGAYPASCTMGTGPFQGVKRPGRGTDHPPSSKSGGHERVGLYLYSPSGPQWPVIGRTFTFTYLKRQTRSTVCPQCASYDFSPYDSWTTVVYRNTSRCLEGMSQLTNRFHLQG